MFKLTPNWHEILRSEFEKDYFLSLQDFLKNEYSTKLIYPEAANVFNALNYVKYDEVKVVIIGQDPYHEKGQAHGLCFSVLEDVKIPPSLKNIFKEIKSEYGYDCESNGNLKRWAKQGILMINTVLTVEDGKANSHKGKGWETFTKRIIQLLSERQEQIIFVLWGNNAKSFKGMIDEGKHVVLQSAHPSPLSAYNGFWGNGHFKKINQILKEAGKQEIDWH